MRLYLYFAKRFTLTLLILFSLFALLAMLLDMIEVLQSFDSANLGVLDVLSLTALKIPLGLYQIMPLIVILATLTLFLSLARSSELIIARAAGRSALRSLLAPISVAFLFGLVNLGLFNPIVAATSKQYETLSSRYRGSDNSSVLSVSREGLWLRQGSSTGQTVIRAKRTNLDGTHLFAVTFISFDFDGLPLARVEAESARLVAGAWQATGAKQWKFEENQNAELGAATFATLNIASDLTPEQIKDGFGAPSSIAIWDLPAFIDRLERAGFSARRHRVWFQAEIAQPVLLVTMVLIGAGFSMRHTRFGRTGMMVLLAIVSGFAIYFIRNLAQVLGENAQIPVLLAAWAPPIAGLLLSLGFLLHLEDG